MSHLTTENTFIIVGVIIAYILFTTWLTFRIRSKNSGDFMEGPRAMPTFIVGILLMLEYIGTKSTIGTAQATFGSGIAASRSVLGAAIGFPLFGLILVKRVYSTGKITISGAIAEKHDNSTKNIISLIMIYTLLLANIGDYISGATAVSTALKVNLSVAASITAIASASYFAFGGMRGVAWVTVSHSALRCTGLLIILGFVLSKVGDFSPTMEKMPDYYWTWDGNIGAGAIFAWLIGTIGSIFCTQFVIQTISSTKDIRSMKRSTWIAFFFCLPIAFTIAIIDVTARYLHPEINGLYALPVFLRDMNPWLAGLVTTSLVASIFVSISAAALAIASLVMKDFYVPWHSPTPDQEFRATCWASLAIGFLPLIFVLLVPGVLKLSLPTRAIHLPITVVAVITFYAPFFRSTRGANAGLISTCMVMSVRYLLSDPFSINNMCVTLATPAIIMVIDRLVPNKSQPSPAPVEQRGV